MNKLTLALLIAFATVFAGCGMPTLTIFPPTGTYIYGHPNTDFVVISHAPEGTTVHYNLKQDGTTAEIATCSSTAYVHDTDIPIYIGTTSVNAVACDKDGKRATTESTTFVTITETVN